MAARKRKSTSSRRSRSSARALPAWLTAPAALLSERWATVAVAALLVGGAAAWMIGQGALRDRAGAIRSEPVQVRFEWPALAGQPSDTWMPASVRESLERLVRESVSDNVFDQPSLAGTRRALQASGWFERVDRVERRRGGVIAIDAVWRTPKAVVRAGGRDHLVADGGVLLPLSYRPGNAGSALPVIQNTAFGPPTNDVGAAAPGAPWQGGDVQASLLLLDTLRSAFSSTWVWPQIAGIDASSYRQSRRLAIVTDRGGRVVWGAPPDIGAPGELSTEQKIAQIVRIANENEGRIDAGEARVEIYGPYVLVDRRGQSGAGR